MSVNRLLWVICLGGACLGGLPSQWALAQTVAADTAGMAITTMPAPTLGPPPQQLATGQHRVYPQLRVQSRILSTCHLQTVFGQATIQCSADVVWRVIAQRGGRPDVSRPPEAAFVMAGHPGSDPARITAQRLIVEF